MDPNIAKPTTNPTTAAVENTLLVKSRSGMTGSGTRDSTNPNATTDTTASTDSPITCTEPQSQLVPPRLVTSTMQVATVASSVMPQTSIFGDVRAFVTGSTAATTTSASAPIGRFT